MNRKTFILILLTALLALPGLPAATVQASPGMIKVERTPLANGMILLLSEEHSLPFVTIQVLLDGGARSDPEGQEGVAHLTARGLLWGTEKRSATAISEELDFVGASLNGSAARDFITLTLRVLRKDLDLGMDIFADVLAGPTFPQSELEREIEKTIAAIKSAEDDPGDVAEKTFIKTLFSGSPYGHPIEGTAESVARLTREQILLYFSQWVRPNNAILTVAGDITPEEVKTRILPRLDNWKATELPASPFSGSFVRGPKKVGVERSITQSNIIVGSEGVSRDNPDFYAITVMNYILGGGGFSSRLTDEIRVKRGLAYSVGSYFDYGKYPGSFQVVLQTKNASAREALSLATEEMKKLQDGLVSEKELEGAKKYLVGSFPMRLGTQAKLVGFFSQVEYYGIGLDYPERYGSLINGVTREDINKAAKTYLHPERQIVVIVGNLKEAGMESEDSTGGTK
jgi:zinc protease